MYRSPDLVSELLQEFSDRLNVRALVGLPSALLKYIFAMPVFPHPYVMSQHLLLSRSALVMCEKYYVP